VLSARSKLKTGCVGVLLASSSVMAQRPAQSHTTVRTHRVMEEAQSVAPQVAQAESSLEKQDFAAAEMLLTDVVTKDAADFRAWFDLGFLYHATKRDPLAISAYDKTVALKPTLFEANLRLGQLLLLNGNSVEAIHYLRAATQLKPESDPKQKLADAWMALGEAQENSQPADAISSYRKAAELLASAAPHIRAGALLEKQKDYSGAESEFKDAMRSEPQSSEAIAGLVNVYTAQQRLPEAEGMLRELTKREPPNASAQLQLGRVLIAENKIDEAIPVLEKAQNAAPQDRELMLELGRAYVAAKNYPAAAEMYHDVLSGATPTAQLLYESGVVLSKARRFTEAQQQLIEALKLDPKMTEAYGELAVSASEAKNYPLVLKVLEARAKLTPDTAGTHFMRATAYDNMKQFKEAAVSYHKFLETAEGKYPDQEWQARHRLIAIEKKR
jgi:tetratricopeptide (TPR) repeat protein